ncbi:hypothetical protein HDU87_002900 [Geranomyces variabilis]|uniref:Major facilitator superfamily (MFS) profile domain-containing protein n=1 Tax=Geranomyces variabilis TaxID=109894 RepID=A0AAD5TMX0_9FUNG|nr:hypothetical protein HDU87_002900 [Geranomyces variabilis]
MPALELPEDFLPARRRSYVSIRMPPQNVEEPPVPSRRRSSVGRLHDENMILSAATLELPASTEDLIKEDEKSTGDEPDLSKSPTTDSNQKRTPLPKKQMAVVCLVTFVEPLQFGVLFPFVYFMVEGYFPTLSHAALGSYVGVITSAFCVAQLVTAIPWGYASDRVGRKPVLLIGLTGNAIFMTLFGAAGKYWEALLFRCVCGALNGNVGVAKSVIGEITDDTNRALAFSFWETAFGLGAIVGPMIGGLLADPTHSLGFVFGNSRFLAANPYFLPCAACAFFSVIGIFLTLFGYKETLNTLPQKPPPVTATSTETIDASPVAHPALIHRGSIISIDELPSPRTSFRALMTSKILLPATAYGLWALIQVLFDETLAIYAVSPRGPAQHGLELTSRVLGLVLAATGVLQVFAQVVLYPPSERRVGVLGCLKGACLGMAVFVVGAGCVGQMVDGAAATASVLGVMLVGRTIAIVFGYISIMIMINNSAPTPAMLGTVHGIGQMACSAARAIGPAFAGVLWTKTAGGDLPFPVDYHLPFLLMSLLAMGCGLVAAQLTRIAT